MLQCKISGEAIILGLPKKTKQMQGTLWALTWTTQKLKQFRQLGSWIEAVQAASIKLQFKS